MLIALLESKKMDEEDWDVGCRKQKKNRLNKRHEKGSKGLKKEDKKQ